MKTLRILVGVWLLALSAVAAHGADVETTPAPFRYSGIRPSRARSRECLRLCRVPQGRQGAAGVGGAFGKGQVYRGGKVTGQSSLFQLSIGAQLGGEAYSEIIFFQDKRAYDEFTRGDFAFDATVSAVAITAAAQSQIGTTGKSSGASVGPQSGKQLAAGYVKGMAVFTHIKAA